MNTKQLLGFDSHISERYNKNLLGIFHSLLSLGGMAEEQMHILQSSIASDMPPAIEFDQIDVNKKKVDRLDAEINEAVVQVIATNQPIASDLRLLVASIKITTELERIGEEIQKICRIIVKNENVMADENSFNFEDLQGPMENLSVMLHRTLDAFARMNAEEARKVIKADRKLEREYAILTRALLTHIMQNPARVALYMDVSDILHSIQRIGDHIASIAEHLIFIITGRDVRYLSAKQVKQIVEQSDGK